MTHDHSQRMSFALQTAREAADATMRWFQHHDLTPEGKSDGSPVTQADRQAERLVRDAVARDYPDDGVLGEEYPPTDSRSGWTWVIDPIDGTRSFVQGVPLFGTMLACMEHGEPRIGVIVMPALGECVGAEIGSGCWWWRDGREPVRARVSERETVAGSVVLSTSLEYYPDEPTKRAWVALSGAGAITRGWSDCYAFVLLATGRADAVIEPGVKIWDIASVPPIVTEAGGSWTDLTGRQSLHAGSIIATNRRLHAAIVAAMSDPQ